MSRMLKVQATRTFQSHNAGDVFLVEEDAQIRAFVKARLFDVLAVELDTVEPVAPVGGVVVEPVIEAVIEPVIETVIEPVAESDTDPVPKDEPKAKKAKKNV